MSKKNKLLFAKLIAFVAVTTVAIGAMVYFPNVPPILRSFQQKLSVDLAGDEPKPDKRFMKWFNRDPERVVPNEKNIVVSPADGVVERVFKKGTMWHVVIEMRYTDVHVQRVPISGRVVSVEGGGEKLKEGYGALDYEIDKMLPYQKITTFETEIGIVLVRQITSFFADRIKVFLEIDKFYQIGDRLGVVLAGSTVVIQVPANIKIVVKKNDEVTAGETIVGRY